MVELEKDIKDAIAQRTGSDTNLSQTLVDRLMEAAKEMVDKKHGNRKPSTGVMKMRMKSLCIAVVLFSLCLSEAFGWDAEYKNGFALSKRIKSSDLVVVGSVAEKEFVYRANIRAKFTTDITIDVDHVLKGTPNAGENRVKFMIKGGEGVNPRSGRLELWWNSDTPEFIIGERVLLFLYHSKSHLFRNYPHNQLRLHRLHYGKNVIKNDKVGLLFPLEDNSLRFVKMPVDLVIPLAKAAVKDEDKMILLEDEIQEALQGQSEKTLLSQDLIDRLMEEAEAIVDRNTETENQESQSQD